MTIMTIHKSKGLEFPIVFLGGCIRNFNTDDIRRPILIHPQLGVGLRFRDTQTGADYSTVARDVISDALISEMKSEEMRILYVALTRAREKLCLVASHNDAAKMIEKVIFENVYPELDKKMLLSRDFDVYSVRSAVFAPIKASSASVLMRSCAPRTPALTVMRSCERAPASR